MATLPEPVLTKVLRVGFRNIRKDPRILNSLFYNLDAQEQQKIRKMVLEQSIDLSLNYPRTTVKAPSIIMLLRNESEAQTFIGNEMGTFPNYGVPDDFLTYDTLSTGESAPATDLSGSTLLLLDNVGVAKSTSTRIYFAESSKTSVQDFLDNAPEMNSMDVYVSKGAGSGKSYTVTKLNSNYLDIDGSIDPQLDTTSIIQFRSDSTNNEVIGEPKKSYSSSQNNLHRVGANYTSQYQFLIITGSQEETIYLFYIVKAILLSQTAYLEGQGLQAMQISGSDLAPRPEFVPNELFQRVLNVTFTYPFSFIEESGPAFSAISVSIGCGLEEDCAGDYDINIPL